MTCTGTACQQYGQVTEALVQRGRSSGRYHLLLSAPLCGMEELRSDSDTASR